jgi:peptide/nickel transport system permease protein
VLKYVIRRLLVLPVILFLVTLVLFGIIMLQPVDQRVRVYLPSVKPRLTPEEYQELLEVTIHRYGLDDPLWVQYARWMGNLLSGDWGYSPTWKQPVLEGLRQRAPATLELTLWAMIPSIFLAIVLGTVAALRLHRLPDHVIRAAASIGWAFPSFVLALVLMNVFYAWLDWFPPERMSVWASELINSESYRVYTGMLTVDALLNANPGLFWDALRHLFLPALTLAVAEWALLTRIMRSSLLEVLRQDYVTTARAKGLPERQVVGRHAQRNAILPLVSASAVVTSLLISGLVIVEVVFSYNGIGRWAFRAILLSDVPVAVGFAVFACVVTVLASLIADIAYAVVDPRVRLF